MDTSWYSVMTKIVLAAMTLVALAGVILLFPINVSDDHTCLLDYIVHAMATAADEHAPHSHPSELLGRYLVPYGLLWWLSIVAVVAAVVAWIQLSDKASNTDIHTAG